MEYLLKSRRVFFQLKKEKNMLYGSTFGNSVPVFSQPQQASKNPKKTEDVHVNILPPDVRIARGAKINEKFFSYVKGINAERLTLA